VGSRRLGTLIDLPSIRVPPLSAPGIEGLLPPRSIRAPLEVAVLPVKS
jgi:hypothetical protein